MKRILQYYQDNFFKAKTLRTQLLLKNVVASFGIKGWSLVVQLLLVPLSLKCLTNYEYGIWLTLNSVLLWIDTFDIGLGNGLRNKLTESMANGNLELARRQVSTTLISMSIIASVICIGASIAIYYCDVYGFINVNPTIVPNLHTTMYLLCVTVCMTFVSKTISSIYLALQLPAISNLMSSIGSTLALLGIWILSLLNIHSLMLVSLMYTVMPLVTFIAFSIYSFGFKYRMLSPSLNYFDRSTIHSLMSLGIKFFIGQLSGLILLLTINLVISKALSPEQVTPYQIAYRYFSILLIPFMLISSSIWSATTDAYSRGEITWIKTALRKMEYLMLAFWGMLMVMLLLSGAFYQIWVGNRVEVPWLLSALVALFMAFYISGQCYSTIIYGIGKINVTIFTVAAMALFFISLAFPVTRRYGLEGLITLHTFVAAICTLQNMLQCKLILSGKARGVFNK